jgi:hypothetical protein
MPGALIVAVAFVLLVTLAVVARDRGQPVDRSFALLLLCALLVSPLGWMYYLWLAAGPLAALALAHGERLGTATRMPVLSGREKA